MKISGTIRTLGLIATMLLAMPLLAQEAIEGKYVEIKPAQPTQTGDKVEVLEVFWYGCPHCYSFEPFVEEWEQNLPEDVEFIRLPGVLSQNWIPHAKAYYTAQKLGVLDRTHRALFDAIHKERRQIFTDDQIRGFFIEQGIAAKDFDEAWNSREIDTKIRQAYFAARDYKLTGVPSMIINGKYLTSGTHVKGPFEELLRVVNTLIERERSAP